MQLVPGRAQRICVRQVEQDAARVALMAERGGLRLQHHRIADPVSGRDSLLDAGAECAAREGDAERGEQCLGLIFRDDAALRRQVDGGRGSGIGRAEIAAGMGVQPLERAEGAFGRGKIRDAKGAQPIDPVLGDRRAFVQPGKDHRFGGFLFLDRAQDRRQLDADGHRIGLDDASDDAAEASVAEQRCQCALIERRVDQALGGEVERVGHADKVRQRGAQGRGVAVVDLWQVEREPLA